MSSKNYHSYSKSKPFEAKLKLDPKMFEAYHKKHSPKNTSPLSERMQERKSTVDKLDSSDANE